MSFVMESIETPAIANPTGPKEFDLPSKEFIGYDPKGKYDITGSPIQREPKQDPKQETITETAAESPASEETVRLAPQISAIARKEQAQRKREQALAQREKALEARLADAEKYSQLKQKIASKDYSAADELGLTYDEYTQYLIDKQSKDNPEDQRYRQQEEKIAALQRSQEEKETRDYEQNQALWKDSITTHFGEGTEYPNLAYLKSKGMDVVKDVLDHINVCFDEDGTTLTEKQALEQFEAEAVRRAEMYSDAPTVKKKFQEAPRALGAPKASPKTITQNMTVTSQAPSKKPFHMLSESEQWAEAARRVQEERLRQQGR